MLFKIKLNLLAQNYFLVFQINQKMTPKKQKKYKTFLINFSYMKYVRNTRTEKF